MDAAVLPESWCVATLNDIARPFGGSTPSKSDASFWTDGTVPWVSPKDMKVFELRGSEDLVSEKALARLSLIPEGSILVVVRSGILSRILPVAINHLPVTINQDMRAFVPAPEISARFIAWQLLANQREILGKCSKDGTTVASIEAVALASFPFALPPAAEQHRIVAKIEELFSELDQGVASLKTAREQLKVYRQSLLKNAFEGKLTAAWRAAHTDQLESAAALQQRIACERQARHQQQLADWQAAGQPGPKPKPPKPLPPLTAEELAELPELPAGWVYSYLADMGDLGRGKSKHRPRNDPRLFGGSFPFIQTGEVKAANRVVRSYSQTYSEFGLAQSKLWPKGTLCITIAANIAQTAFLGFDGCFPDSVVGFTAFEPVVRAEYIDYFIQAARTRIEAYAPATAQKNINLETLENLVVPYCSRAEQEAVLCELESKLSEADQLDQTLATALQQADALRQSILKKAFHGQLEKQDKNEEPATALLERIRAARSTNQPARRGRSAGSQS
ncbi:MAG: restriction endonuclease subunit S [Azonexus sp.]|nr:restriction endonuclease subunit S [Azonexus sp.]MBP6202406.1 restriction endonuclease subunit S [Azonexus sp.]